MPESAKKSFVVFTYFVLILGTLLVFGQVRNFGFINYDDSDYVYENPHVFNGLTADGIVWAFTTNHSANWHPLTWLSLMLDCQLFGANPGRMHLVNLLLHLANTLLLFAVLRKMTGTLWPSAFVAAAFAIHPMHVESVAWITERKDVLSTFFLLLTLAAYAGYVKRPSAFRYVAALAAFAMGLMAKPMLVTLPFLLLLLDYWPMNRLMPQTTHKRRKSALSTNNPPTLYRIILEKIPFFVFSVISSVITFLIQQNAGAVGNINILSLNNCITNTFLSYAQYIGKMFWPQNLAVFYPFNVVGTIPFWQVVVCALLLFGISFLVIHLGRNQRYLILGWFWFVATLIPVIGIIQIGLHAYADRYTYVPYIGLFIIIAWGLPQLLSKWTSASSVESSKQRTVLGVSMVIALTALGISAHRQVSYWNNSFKLFSHALEVTQNNYIAYDHLGVAYGELGRSSEAIDAFKQTIKIKPNFADAHYNLGVAYSGLNRLPDAINAFKQAVKINPDLANAYYNLGVVYNRIGRYTEAIDANKQAIKIKPDLAKAHYALGVNYLATGDKNSALEEYKILKNLDADKASKLSKSIYK